MKQEDKELLIRDLCSRLPYRVMVREDTVLYDDKNTTSYRVKKLDYELIGKGFLRIKGFIHDYEYIYKPYLFPLSSMTEEQKEEIEDKLTFPNNSDGGWIEILYNNKYEIPFWFVDFCNKNHLDYRGLIPMGLAIDATNLNVY